MKKLFQKSKLVKSGKLSLPRFNSGPLPSPGVPGEKRVTGRGEERKCADEGPSRGRLLAVGDIHGCLGALQCLISRVGPRADDQFVFLGDYIDRGPESREVVECLLRFQKCYPDTVFLKGNHEAMLLDYLQGKNTLLYMANGGWETLKSYATDGRTKISPSHLEFFENLRLFYERESFIFVHAGLRPGIALEDQGEENLLWIRREFLDSDFDFGKTVVFGHTPLPSPLQEKNKIGLDTGAVYGRYLTCCDVRRRRFWDSMDCKKDGSG
jgi:serine/threonine protein phosphatase 1